MSNKSNKRFSQQFQQIVSLSKHKHDEERKNQTVIQKVAELWQRDSTHTKNINLQRIIYILKCYQKNRSDEQLETVRQYFDENFTYFSKFKEKLDQQSCHDLFREMTLETYEPNRLIFKHGDSGRKMYFVLQGSAGILIPKTKYTEDNYCVMTKIISFEDCIKIQFPDFTLVNVKQEGEVFGEIAIEQKVTRTASVLSKTHLTLAVITFDLYQRILGAFKHEMTNQKLQFLSNIPIFAKWYRQNQLVLLASLDTISVKTGTYIFRRGAIDDYIYIVVSGEVEIVHWVQRSEDNLSIRANIEKQCTMSIINSGQFFGDYEHFMQFPKRKTMARARVDTSFYKIKFKQLSDFFALFSSIEDLYGYLRTKFEIENNMKQKNSEHIDQDEIQGQVLDMEMIKSSYYKKVKVQEKIEKIKKKIEKTSVDAQKVPYIAEIEQLKQSIENLETMQADKYAFLVPHRGNPYINEKNLVKSQSTTKHRLVNKLFRTQHFLSIDSNNYHFKTSPKVSEHRSIDIQKRTPISYSKIIENRLQKLHLTPLRREICTPQIKSLIQSHSLVDNIHNTISKPLTSGGTRKTIQEQKYKFELKSFM